ncbi:hypothetical protein KI387_036858, partial [Taxus chinensis]
KNRVKITPDILNRALAECPSDTMALNIFIWFGNRNACKPSSQSYDHMAGVIRRIIQKHGTANGVLEELRDTGCATSVQTVTALLRIYSHA